MYIPKMMKKTIASRFYDKNIEVLTKIDTVDDEGGITSKGYDVIDNFKGNVNFSNCKQIQEDYGLDYEIDVSITTNYELLRINDIIKYQEIVYKVNDVLFSDSHILIVGSKWRQ